MSKSIEEIRETLHLLKPKTFNALDEDHGNLLAILKEYKAVARLARDLVKLPGKTIHEALTSQPAEFYFFKMCTSNLKTFVDYFEAFLRHNRAKKYKEIRESSSLKNSDRELNTLVDEDETVLYYTMQVIQVREVYDSFISIVESYNQRGYALNNITKILEISASETVL